MLKKVTDDQYNTYLTRLSSSVNSAKSPKTLRLLQPSLVMAQRQATTNNRAFRILCILQDYNSKCRVFDKLHKDLVCTK